MHRHPLTCILPPHMLKEIIRNGNERQRAFALQTLQISAQFRGQRQAARDLAVALALTAAPGKQRVVYDAQGGAQLPGIPVRREGEPPVEDPAVNEAYDGSGLTYDLFSEIYGRNSIDGNGLRLDSTVHYLKGYDNAFWNGQQMVYGDGDEDLPPSQRLFNRFTVAVDIIGHELTHGVTEYEAKLAYYGQSGALNESMSDVFGALVKQYQRRESADQADWVIGAGLFTANVNGIGIRSLKAPGSAYDDPLLGKDPQPAHMRDYVNTVEDNGGVHINSGIPNHAFYVTAREIGGYAWEKAGHIWYLALRDKLTATSNFQQAADLTWQTAGQIYGAGSLEQQAVKTGWAEVGILVNETTTPPPSQGDGCLPTLLRAIGLKQI
ncbi:MAG: M4 family metallopeptidase [Anaerolineales bacterium]|nr:M4 family metallopeptidase [Anaerolineales bacterium]